MAASSPSTDNYTLGKGVVYFDKKNQGTGLYEGERDLGNAPAFAFSVSLEKLEHFSSRGGLKAKDKEIISQITPSLSFTLDEVTKENLALLTLADLNEVTQSAGNVSAEEVTAHLDLRSVLDYRSIGVTYNLSYDAGSALFVPGEVVTGAGGATGIVLTVTGTAASGTLNIIKTNATAYVDDEALTGGVAGAATANGTEAASTVKNVLVQDDSDTTTYTLGTDYTISTDLKDDTIGRILFLDGGSISEGDTVHVSYAYAAASYTEVRAFVNTQVEGRLRFVSDNPAGTDQELEIWRVSLTPTGDTSMIGDDWSTLGFTGEVLKDETGHPDSPYMNFLIA